MSLADNLTHVHQSSTIDRTEAIVVGGQSVDTFRGRDDIKISGDVNARTHTTWASPVYKVGCVSITS